MKYNSITYKSASVSYYTNGSGYPIFLIHGFGEDSTIWNDFTEELSKEFLTIVVDIPGSGKSEALKDQPTINDFADLILAIVEKENIKKIHLCGHSMGGYISLAFAKKYADRLSAITLFHSSSYADDEMKKETRLKAIQLMEEKGTDAFLKTMIPGLFNDKVLFKNEINELISKAKAFSPEVLIQYYRAMIDREETSDVLKNIHVPVQFIIGEKDKVVPFKHALAQSHLPSYCFLSILRNSAHMGMIEEKEKSFDELRKFLRECSVK